MSSNITVYGLDDPLARKLLIEHVGKQAIEYLTSILGPGFCFWGVVPENAKPECRGLSFSIDECNHLDVPLNKLVLDIIRNKIFHFTELPNTNETMTFRRSAVCIRVGIQQSPLSVHIDYYGWK